MPHWLHRHGFVFAEQRLMEAYDEAALPTTCVIMVNFGGLDYLCSGMGLLILLLKRATRQKQRLLSYGLSDHYRSIFTLTRLCEVIPIYESEAEALAAASRLLIHQDMALWAAPSAS